MNNLKKQIDSDLELPRGETRVLQAEDKDYNRGLLVKLLKDGGYDVVYWYDKLKAYPIEVLVDGKSVKKDAKKVTFKFHPELEKALDISKENGGTKKRKKRRKRTGIDKLADFVSNNSPERKMIKDLASFVVKALEKDEKKFQEGKKFRQQTSSMAMNDNVARVDYMKTWMGGYQADALQRGGAKDRDSYTSNEIEEETEEREFK